MKKIIPTLIIIILLSCTRYDHEKNYLLLLNHRLTIENQLLREDFYSVKAENDYLKTLQTPSDSLQKSITDSCYKGIK